MPQPTQRPSLKTSLSQRYGTQSVGGAYKDKNIITKGVDPLFASFQSKKFQTDDGFNAGVSVGTSQFIDDGNGTSTFVGGLNTTKYSSAAITVPS